jgi:hypothetical protein
MRTVATNIMFLDIIHPSVLYKKHDVSETGFCLRLQVKLISWTQSIELVPISGHLRQHKIEYTSQAHHKPSARAKTKILKYFKNTPYL